MGMIKVVSPDSFSFGEPIMQIIKMASGGLKGLDRKQLEKRASVSLLQELDSLREKAASDETLVHMLVVGATEDYGANRNGDGFRRRTCQNYHPTFVKYARFYRNHQNKDPKKSYGRVIKSAWHAPMSRIELVCALNSSDTAAKRNDGLLADREMEKLASGKDIPVSMACKVGYDVCSYCGNKAPTVQDYCTGTSQGGMCKAGGLRDNIGSLIEIDGGIHQLHADNPHPAFFDVSHVPRQADRIAYVTGTLEKQASFHGVIKSAELAAHLNVSIPYEMLVGSNQPPQVQKLIKLAYLLSDREQLFESGQPPLTSSYAAAFDNEVQGLDEDMPLPPFFKEKFALALRALSEQHICLPLERFVEVVAECPREKAAEIAAITKRELPGIYTRLLTRNDFPELVKESQYTPATAVAPPQLAYWAVKQAAELSCSQQHVSQRVRRAALRNRPTPELRQSLPWEKSASAENDHVARMATEYALYKLAFLASLPDNDPDLTLTNDLVLLQNYTN